MIFLILAVIYHVHLMVHGWDVAFGTNTSYCGFAHLSHSVDFYCQRGS
jgi:hypothetical protein